MQSRVISFYSLNVQIKKGVFFLFFFYCKFLLLPVIVSTHFSLSFVIYLSIRVSVFSFVDLYRLRIV